MAQIPRPPKQGAVMTYVAKVAAGYPHILAGEVDADLDTIYGAWNSGVDTVNIRDGAVTSAKLAADSVGPRELQDSGIGTTNLADGSVTTPKLADLNVTTGKLADGAVTTAKLPTGAVTDPKIVSVAWTKVTGAPTTFPPSGAAGGDLVGSTYPNPIIAPGVVTADKLAPGTLTGANLSAGSVGAREIADGSIGVAELADAVVTRAKLAPGILPGDAQFVAITNFTTSTIGSWVRVATLPALTTRGTNAVFLYTNHGLGVAVGAGPGNVLLRWVRDGTQLCNTAWGAGGGTNLVAPLPSLPWMDVVPGAGSYVYALEVQLGPGVSTVYFVATNTGCALMARELG
jgi:hypothetical protein